MSNDRAALAAERSLNERYIAALRERAGRTVIRVAAPRNTIWTDSVDRGQPPNVAVLPLAGRVGFAVDDPDLGRGFYIGSEDGWVQEIDDNLIVSWAAPVARLFYAGPLASDVLANHVVVRRTFTAERLDIVSFVDDEDGDAGLLGHPFTSVAQRPLAIPTPAPATRPRPRSSVPIKATPKATTPVREGPRRAVAPGPVLRSPPVPGAELRAEPAVREAIVRPRTGRLGTVLSTLQPDQYRLVTWPHDQRLIVQGPPGTGKTIIATHRAAYLVHPAREPAPLDRVVVLGPTDEYTDHVRDSIANLDPNGKVKVQSLPGLLSELVGQRIQGQQTSFGERVDTDWAHARLLAATAQRLRSGAQAAKLRGNQGAQVLVDTLLKDAASGRLGGLDAELRAWYTDVRTYERAIKQPRCLPFLAAAALITKPGDAHRLQHLVIDEAQDVRPLEWRILISLAETDGALSILGDMNQRRCDWSPSSWSELGKALEWTDDDGNLVVETLTKLYRSTRQILRFANGLLSREQRAVDPLRDGDRPKVRKTPTTGLWAAVEDEARTLAGLHPDGLVAVISVDPKGAVETFRTRGWRRDAKQGQRWRKGGSAVLVYAPNDARGLEFDGVVVVEPSDFPENVGRLGALYTSLTRATTRLTVVHAKALPKGLRP